MVGELEDNKSDITKEYNTTKDLEDFTKTYFSKDDDVSYSVREIFKKYTSQYPKTFWMMFGRKNLNLFYKYWLQHQQADVEFDWVVEKEFFYINEEDWKNYIKRLESYSGLKISEDKQSFVIEGDKRLKFEKMFKEAINLEDQ